MALGNKHSAPQGAWRLRDERALEWQGYARSCLFNDPQI
jgi:hypothetical protein